MIFPKLVKLVGKKEGELGRRLTNREIAEITGVHERTIGRWMRGEPMVGVKGDVLLSLLDFFGCTLDDLIEVRRVRVRK